jgi:hypothetical protein
MALRADVLTVVSTHLIAAHVFPRRVVLTRLAFPQINRVICVFDSRQLHLMSRCAPVRLAAWKKTQPKGTVSRRADKRMCGRAGGADSCALSAAIGLVLHRFGSSQGSDAANLSSSEIGMSTFAPLRLARMRPAARSRSSSLTERLRRRAASARSTNMATDAVSVASAGAGTCSARVMAEN